ncbi:MAG TPA: sortase [Clostridiaceae bacterium]|nr:sortase [Clostridiaceae bacterium]
MKNKINAILTVVAVILLVLGLYLLIKPYWQNYLQDGKIEDVLAEMGTAIPEEEDTSSIGPVNELEVSFSADQYVVAGEDWEDFSRPEGLTVDKEEIVSVNTYARLDIPSIGFSMPVADEATLYSLRIAIGHHQSTARIGATGNAVLFGHRGYRTGRYFNEVHKINLGDEIRIVTKDAAYIYSMVKSIDVEPSELWDKMEESTDKARVILVSCTPLRNTREHKRGDLRILVYGELKEIIPLVDN